MSNALCVYTAIVGDIGDRLSPISIQPDSSGRPVEYVCFTDSSIVAPNGWKLRPLLFRCTTPRVTARWHKIMSHLLFPTAPYTLWHDGSHHLKFPPWEAIDSALAKGELFATFKHPVRDCAYDEARTCVKLGKDSRKTLFNQIKFYKSKGFPSHAGLYETGCVIRKNSQSVANLNELWFTEVNTRSCRDQIALPYAIWTLPFEGIGLIPGRGTESPLFHFRAHKKGIHPTHGQSATLDTEEGQTFLSRLNRDNIHGSNTSPMPVFARPCALVPSVAPPSITTKSD